MRPNYGRCRSCNAEIRWVVMAGTGKNNPINVPSTEKGNVWIDEDGYAHVVSEGNPAPYDAVLYLSHFVTCKQAKEWKR